jgi:hypothetical protein
LENYSEASDKQLTTCATYGDTISEEWTCSEIEQYFD